LVFVKNDFSDNSAVIQAINHGLAPAHMPKLFARRNAAGQMELQPIDPHWSNFMLSRYKQTPGRLRAWLLQQSKFYRGIEENAWRVRLLLGRWWYGPSAVAYDLKIDHRNIARLCQSLQPVKSQTRTVSVFHGFGREN
jgi:hypothetical protein